MNAHNQPVPAPRQSAALSDVTPNQTGSQDGVIFASASRSFTGDATGAGNYISEPIVNTVAKGVRLFIKSSGAATGTLTTKIQIQDPATKTWINLSGATTAAIDGTGAGVAGFELVVYPGVATGANYSNNALGPLWRVHTSVALAPITYSIGADYLA